MKKFTLLIASLFITVGAMAQVDYTPTNTGAKPRTNRMVSTITVGSDTYTMPTGTEATRNSYTDLTATKTFRVQAGSTVNLALTDDPGDWMNAFVYVDTDNNGFTAGVEADGYTPTGDLVSFSFYSNSTTSDASGKNSAGTTLTDGNRNTFTLPSWTVPDDLTPGEYRIRFKYDWNNIDPDGGQGTYFGNTFTGHGGEIIDATLEVVKLPEYTITYNYKQGDVLIGSISHKVIQGAQYPDLISAYGVTVNGTKPTGTVTEDDEIDIDVTIGEMPFEYYEGYAAVEEANGWYNLIMHSNWNTGNGTAKYRTYLSHNESGSTLAWGTERSLTNPSDAHYWAFVGNPINGFRVVNKATGAEKVLSSNGTTNPLMTATEGMADGYNTTWEIANRKYDVSTEGDYIREGAWFCLKYPGSNNYINANAGNGNVAFWSDNDNGSGILAVKPLTIDAEADLATFYTDNYVKMPSTLGAEVYYATEVVNSNYIHLELISGEVIPAQTGVVVKYAVENNVVYAPEITSQGTTTAVTGNLLKGTTKRTLISKDANKSYYVLGMTDGVGFYNAVNGANENEFYNGAFKAYLELPAAQGTAAFYGFDWNGTTGVEKVEIRNEKSEIYDLTGRRVEAITAPGIYVVGGKKVLVK